MALQESQASRSSQLIGRRSNVAATTPRPTNFSPVKGPSVRNRLRVRSLSGPTHPDRLLSSIVREKIARLRPTPSEKFPLRGNKRPSVSIPFTCSGFYRGVCGTEPRDSAEKLPPVLPQSGGFSARAASPPLPTPGWCLVPKQTGTRHHPARFFFRSSFFLLRTVSCRE